MTKYNTISIVVPCFNEEESIKYYFDEMKKVMNNFKDLNSDVEFEIIFVDDGSKDSTLKVLKELNIENKIVKYISFSRNFGKEAAIYAGLEYASGDLIGVMDVDLQDPPHLLLDMYKYIANEGYECVATRRVTRKGEPIIRSFFARKFYKIINSISKTEIVDGARDYRLMTKNMKDAVLSLKEYNRFSKGIFGWVGFKTKWLEYENAERKYGETKWSFWKLFIYSLDGITAFSTVPLSISTFIGMLFSLFSFMLILFIIIRKLLFGDPVNGWASTMCVIMFVGGIQLFCMGILGQYLSKTYTEAKKRPLYIVKEKDNMYE